MRGKKLSEGDQNEGNALPEAPEAEPQFRNGDLHLEQGAHQETCDQYVKLTKTLKQTLKYVLNKG